MGIYKTGEHTDKRKPHDKLACDLGGTDGCHAQVERSVGACVLDGMARLVGGNSQGGDGCAAVVALAEDQPAMGRIIVVGEFTGAGFDGHAINTCVLHDPRGGLSASEAGKGRFRRVFAIDALDAHRSPE